MVFRVIHFDHKEMRLYIRSKINKHMKKLSLKRMKIAAIGNAHFLNGGNNLGITLTCETKCDNTCLCVGSELCTTNPGTTRPNESLIKTKDNCSLNIR